MKTRHFRYMFLAILLVMAEVAVGEPHRKKINGLKGPVKSQEMTMWVWTEQMNGKWVPIKDSHHTIDKYSYDEKGRIREFELKVGANGSDRFGYNIVYDNGDPPGGIWYDSSEHALGTEVAAWLTDSTYYTELRDTSGRVVQHNVITLDKRGRKAQVEVIMYENGSDKIKAHYKLKSYYSSSGELAREVSIGSDKEYESRSEYIPEITSRDKYGNPLEMIMYKSHKVQGDKGPAIRTFRYTYFR